MLLLSMGRGQSILIGNEIITLLNFNKIEKWAVFKYITADIFIHEKEHFKTKDSSVYLARFSNKYDNIMVGIEGRGYFRELYT